jgi:hypothetical protein
LENRYRLNKEMRHQKRRDKPEEKEGQTGGDKPHEKESTTRRRRQTVMG